MFWHDSSRETTHAMEEESMASYGTTRNRAGKGATYGYKQQSDLIVQCARKCFERKGVRKTTLVQIAHEANMTRELIYYYFSGKDEIVQCVFDLYVQDAMETVRLWCDEWETKEGSCDDLGERLSREAITDAVASMRRFLFKQNGERRPMFAVLDEMGEKRRFMRLTSELVYQAVAESKLAGRVHALFPRLSDEEGPMALKLVLMGVMGVMEGSNARDDAHIVDLLVGDTR